jgi:hypothetical protein
MPNLMQSRTSLAAKQPDFAAHVQRNIAKGCGNGQNRGKNKAGRRNRRKTVEQDSGNASESSEAEE